MVGHQPTGAYSLASGDNKGLRSRDQVVPFDLGHFLNEVLVMHPGHLDMRRLGELLLEAAKEPTSDKNMVISAPGALTIAARALREMSAPLDKTLGSELLCEDFDDRISSNQPGVAAHSLETMARHFEMLHGAVKAGDATTVGRFFRLYVFD